MFFRGLTLDVFVSHQNLERYRRLASKVTTENERRLLFELLAKEQVKFIAALKAPEQHHHCPDCTAPMHLVSIEPESQQFDRRTFNCPKCHYSETVIVRFDWTDSSR